MPNFSCSAVSRGTFLSILDVMENDSQRAFDIQRWFPRQSGTEIQGRVLFTNIIKGDHYSLGEDFGKPKYTIPCGRLIADNIIGRYLIRVTKTANGTWDADRSEGNVILSKGIVRMFCKKTKERQQHRFIKGPFFDDAEELRLNTLEGDEYATIGVYFGETVADITELCNDNETETRHDKKRQREFEEQEIENETREQKRTRQTRDIHENETERCPPNDDELSFSRPSTPSDMFDVTP